MSSNPKRMIPCSGCRFAVPNENVSWPYVCHHKSPIAIGNDSDEGGWPCLRPGQAAVGCGDGLAKEEE